MRESLVANRGKVPGERRRGGWVGKRSWPEFEATVDDIAAWEASGAGIGMQGRNFPALDIDVDDIELADQVHELAISTLGVAPTRFGRGSRRILVYAGSGFNKRRMSFRRSNPADGAVEIDAIQAVELLATGQQYVVEGIHPKTQLPYLWQDGQSPAVIGAAALWGLTGDALDGFFEKLEALLDMFGYEVTNRSAAKGKSSAVAQAGLLAPSVEAIGRALAAIPNEVDYDTWMKLLAAVKGAAGPEREAEAYALFEDWSLQWPENTPEGVLAKWRSFHPPYQVGWDYLARFAQDEGDGSFFSAHEDFDAVAEAPEPGATTGPVLSPALRKMFDDYVWVEGVRRMVDLKTGAMLDREQFNVRHAHIGDPSDGKKSAWAVALRDYRNLTTAAGLTYRPGAPLFHNEELPSLTGKCVNRWRPTTISCSGPVNDTDIKPWLDHLAFIVADEKDRSDVLNWLSWIVQNPGAKPNWGLVIGSEYEGTGKDLLLKPVITALGAKNVYNAGPSQIESEWSHYLDGTRLLIVQEMHLSKRTGSKDRLKPLMASPPETLTVNIKHLPQYEIPNLVAVIFLTNNHNAVATSSHDRRYCVVFSEEKPKDAAYYKRLSDWYDAGGREKVARYLIDRDLEAWDALGRAPDTEAKRQMSKATRSDLVAFLQDSIELGMGALGHKYVSLNEIVAVVADGPERNLATPHRLAPALKQLGVFRFAQRVDFKKDPPAECEAPIGKASTWRWIYCLRDVDQAEDLSPPEIRDLYWGERRSHLAVDDVFSGEVG